MRYLEEFRLLFLLLGLSLLVVSCAEFRDMFGLQKKGVEASVQTDVRELDGSLWRYHYTCRVDVHEPTIADCKQAAARAQVPQPQPAEAAPTKKSNKE